MNRAIILATASLLTLAFAACGGGDAVSTPEVQINTIRLKVVDEEGLPVNGVNVTGGDIFGSTAQGGILERSMVDDGQFQQHLDAAYRVEKSGCIVDQQQVLVDESGGFATITLRLSCSQPLVRLSGDFSRLLFDGDDIWLADFKNKALIKMAIDGTVLGTFPVGGSPRQMAFDGESIWVVIGRDSVTKLDTNGRHLGTFPIRMAELEAVEDAITALAFDGEGIWVSHLTGQATKLALDGTELWTASRYNPRAGSYEHLMFTGNRMVRMEGSVIGRRSLRTFDLDGNHLQYSIIGGGQNNFEETVGNIWDATFGGDGIWLAGSCSVIKIGMDGSVVLGPFQTSVCGGERRLIFDGEYIWVAERGNGAVSLVSRIALDGRVLDIYPVGISISDLVFDGENIWVATADDYDDDQAPTTIAVWKITPD